MFTSFFASALANVFGFLYPAYSSYKALQTAEEDDDKQWLTYWVVFSAFTVFEFAADMFIFWIPFYYEAKLAFILWLQLPQTQGALWVYLRYVEPFLNEHEVDLDVYLNKFKEAGGSHVINAVNMVTDKVKAAMNKDKKEE